MRLSLLEILEATGGGEVGGTQVGETFSTFHTDSREVQQGGVFFALRGQEMDGSGFIGDAVARGAAAVVVERRTDVAAGVVEVVVPDTWTALYALASHALRRVQPLVIAVTGSNGKTSTKEMVAAILSRHFNVLSTQGNLNTETGVPLTILGLEPHHSALVLEMGMQRPGDIGRLAALARPVIGIVTNVGIVHIEFFNSREELARAKGELVAALPEAGLAVLNADNEFYPLLVQMTSARVAGFGIEAGDFRVEGYETLSDGGSRCRRPRASRSSTTLTTRAPSRCWPPSTRWPRPLRGFRAAAGCWRCSARCASWARSPRSPTDESASAPPRSEERRVGKECRSRWSPYH